MKDFLHIKGLLGKQEPCDIYLSILNNIWHNLKKKNFFYLLPSRFAFTSLQLNIHFLMVLKDNSDHHVD